MSNPDKPKTGQRAIRVFVSSTFRDMQAERDLLMKQVCPALRTLCRKRAVEFVEVDLRWGITEKQAQRQETLRLCLNEIDNARPFFIGLLGNRYGWVPQGTAVGDDLLEEKPWLEGLKDCSVTELEILHGVPNQPAIAEPGYFYFRNPAYAAARGTDFFPEYAAAADHQMTLTARIREVCAAQHLPLRERCAPGKAKHWRVATTLGCIR